MSIEIVKGNLLDAFDRGEVTVIGHCVNCQGVMGSGIALSIKQRYPEVFKDYLNVHERFHNKPQYLLGFAQVIPLAGDKTAFNLFGQLDYGIGKRQINYGAIGLALREMSRTGICKFDHTIEKKSVVGFPYNMASDRAGGDWEIILEMIEFYFRDCEVKIYKLEN
jgi:hypothetical protein